MKDLCQAASSTPRRVGASTPPLMEAHSPGRKVWLQISSGDIEVFKILGLHCGFSSLKPSMLVPGVNLWRQGFCPATFLAALLCVVAPYNGCVCVLGGTFEGLRKGF
jgi:hypothetical protein